MMPSPPTHWWAWHDYEDDCTLDLYWKVTQLDAIYSAVIQFQGTLALSAKNAPWTEIEDPW